MTIEVYMKDRFKTIAAENEITGEWPGDDVITDLSHRAQGVFIWAVTVLNFVDAANPQRQLKAIQEGKLRSGDVYQVYSQILEA